MSRPFRPFEFNDPPDERRPSRFAAFLIGMATGVFFVVIWLLFDMAKGIAGK